VYYTLRAFLLEKREIPLDDRSGSSMQISRSSSISRVSQGSSASLSNGTKRPDSTASATSSADSATAGNAGSNVSGANAVNASTATKNPTQTPSSGSTVSAPNGMNADTMRAELRALTTKMQTEMRANIRSEFNKQTAAHEFSVGRKCTEAEKTLVEKKVRDEQLKIYKEKVRNASLAQQRRWAQYQKQRQEKSDTILAQLKAERERLAALHDASFQFEGKKYIAWQQTVHKCQNTIQGLQKALASISGKPVPNALDNAGSSANQATQMKDKKPGITQNLTPKLQAQAAAKAEAQMRAQVAQQLALAASHKGSALSSAEAQRVTVAAQNQAIKQLQKEAELTKAAAEKAATSVQEQQQQQHQQLQAAAHMLDAEINGTSAPPIPGMSHEAQVKQVQRARMAEEKARRAAETNSTELSIEAIIVKTSVGDLVRVPAGTKQSDIHRWMQARNGRVVKVETAQELAAVNEAIKRAQEAKARAAQAAAQAEAAIAVPAKLAADAAKAASRRRNSRSSSSSSRHQPTSKQLSSSASASSRSLESSSGGRKSETSHQHAQYLMSFMRRNHPSLASEVETVLEEIIVKFKPDPDEELLSAVNALHTKCLPYTGEKVSESLQATLERVCRKFFAKQTSTKSWKHRQFVQAYTVPFCRDFMTTKSLTENNIYAGPSSPLDMVYYDPNVDGNLSEKDDRKRKRSKDSSETAGPRRSLKSVMLSLQKWKHILTARIQHQRTINQMRMENCSSELARFEGGIVDIPGQYLTDREPTTQHHVKLVSFGSKIDVLHRTGFSQRRLSLLGSNGHEYHFLVQFEIPHMTRSDERMMQFHEFMNRVMDKCIVTRKRNLRASVPVVIPVTPRVRLIQDNPSNVSMQEMYSKAMFERNIDPDAPMLLLRDEVEKLSNALDKLLDASAACTDSGYRKKQVRTKRSVYGKSAEGWHYNLDRIPATALRNLTTPIIEDAIENMDASLDKTDDGRTILSSFGLEESDYNISDPLAVGAPWLGTIYDHSYALLADEHTALRYAHKYLLGIQDDLIQGKLPTTDNTRSKVRAKALSLHRQRVFEHICENMVPKTIMKDYILSRSASADDFFMLRKEFTQHAAITSFLAYIFCISSRSSETVFVAMNSGAIFNANFRPNYNSTDRVGILDNSDDSVPFRLTRNMEHFISPFGMQGSYSQCMASIAKAFARKYPFMENYLALFLRDDLSSWHASKTNPRSEAKQRKVERQLRERVSTNVSIILKKILELAPNENGINSAVGLPVRKRRNSNSRSREQLASALDKRAMQRAIKRDAEAYVKVENYGTLPTPAWDQKKPLMNEPSIRAIGSKIQGLITQATDTKNLSEMNGLWAPWL
jgi:hypothetical protein